MKNTKTAEKLNTERRKIDNLDKVIIKSLNKRFEIVKTIGKIKKSNNLRIFNPKRETEVLAKADNMPNQELIKNILIKIMEESRNIQEELTCGH